MTFKLNDNVEVNETEITNLKHKDAFKYQGDIYIISISQDNAAYYGTNLTTMCTRLFRDGVRVIPVKLTINVEEIS